MIDVVSSVYKKLDEIGTLIETMYLAHMVGDGSMFNESHDKAGELCFDAMREMDTLEGLDTSK